MHHLCIRSEQGSPHHFLHQTDKLHEAAAELADFLLHFGHMLLVDLHQRLEGVTTMLETAERRIHSVTWRNIELLFI